MKDEVSQQLGAIDIHFNGHILRVSLSGGHEISLPIDKIDWLGWLAQATVEQRTKWSLEPNGFAIYWDELDNGIEISHLLGMQPLA